MGQSENAAKEASGVGSTAVSSGEGTMKEKARIVTRRRTLYFDIPALGVSGKLKEKFSKAEIWHETQEIRRTGVLGQREVMQHPDYPKCIGWIAWQSDDEGSLRPLRGILDDGLTPVQEIAQLALFMTYFLDWREKQRKGGPVPTPQAQKEEIVKGWIEVQGRMSQKVYARGKGVTDRHLRTWISEFIEQGKLIKHEDGILEWVG